MYNLRGVNIDSAGTAVALGPHCGGSEDMLDGELAFASDSDSHLGNIPVFKLCY